MIKPHTHSKKEAGTGPTRTYPTVDARFMVLSDIHLYDTALGQDGARSSPRELQKKSREILTVALDAIAAERPDFVLIPGDLTKDGERQSHETLAAILSGLGPKGIKTYVLPGNHDISNPRAARFLPSGKTEPVANIGPDDFPRIYVDSGYGEALYRDPYSLSYVAQPVPGLWILALDSVKYERNDSRNKPRTSGAIRKQTYAWIEERLAEASQKGVAVLAAVHHPLMEHAYRMKRTHPGFVLDDNWRLARLLAGYDVRLVFSGHFHANSIVRRSWGRDAPPRLRGKYIVDVETGSLSAWPFPYRSVRLSSDTTITISTSRVDQLPSYAAEGKDFGAEGRRILEDALWDTAAAVMRAIGASRRDLQAAGPKVVAALMAHYAGDAHGTSGDLLPARGLSPLGKLGAAYYGGFVRGLWKMRPPAYVELMGDNDLTIHPDGGWTPGPR